MNGLYEGGVAFICEGETEKEFYRVLLGFLCKKHGAALKLVEAPEVSEIACEIRTPDKRFLVKFLSSNAISALPRAGKWFEVECVKKYPRKIKWIVFLCYDTDDYQAEITPFHEGDWKDLRSRLSRAHRIIDLAASADIEDLMLTDVEGVCRYLHCPPTAACALHGRKGAAKMKALFRGQGQSYHKGSRARPMIEQLDMQKIMDRAPVQLNEVEALFEKDGFD